MSGTHPPADAAWTTRLWLAVVGVLAVGGLLAFLAVPLVQGGSIGLDTYTAICRGLGILPGTPARVTPASHAAAQPVTQVAWTMETLAELAKADPAQGAKVAEERCIACHAPDGSSAAPNIPRMAGQSYFAIYKQLHDFQSGARASDIMSPQVEGLDDKAMADVAVYYGGLQRGDSDLQNPPAVGPEIENLVINGDVRRGLPPCTACHGTRAGGPVEVPTLADQHADYIEAQLQAFATGERRNDIYHRMRSVASRLTPHEMHLLAIYYAGVR
ncbi:MAG: c-type cytochrome [Acetobacteraceae bacterium]|nr:c-type cytochrome [Acetobacteraceae bacterium]